MSRTVALDGISHAEIGLRLGISGARVRQIEERAMQKLIIALAESKMLGEQLPKALRSAAPVSTARSSRKGGIE